MYLLIDLDNLRFVRKHPDLFALSDVAYIEHFDGSYVISPIDSSAFLGELTDSELKGLFSNVSGVKHCPWLGAGLRSVLRVMAEEFPLSDIDAKEAKMQADAHDGSSPAKYVRGALRPAYEIPLFPDVTLSIPGNADHIAQQGFLEQARRQQARPQASVVAPARVTPPAPAMPRTSAQVSPQPAKKRDGTVRGTIQEVATREWSAAGSPKDEKDILKLRKELMIKLEKEYSIGRNTSSNELGKWQKQIMST
jgi:hypothetical protein